MRRLREGLVQVARGGFEIIDFHARARRGDERRRCAAGLQRFNAQRKPLGWIEWIETRARGVHDPPKLARERADVAPRASTVGRGSDDELRVTVLLERGRPFRIEILLLRGDQLRAAGLRVDVGLVYVERANGDRTTG